MDAYLLFLVIFINKDNSCHVIESDFFFLFLNKFCPFELQPRTVQSSHALYVGYFCLPGCLKVLKAKCFYFADIAAKLGHRDVCNLTPTAIAIEVGLSLSLSRTTYLFMHS